MEDKGEIKKIRDRNRLGNVDQVVKKCSCKVSKPNTISVMEAYVQVITAVGKRGSMIAGHVDEGR